MKWGEIIRVFRNFKGLSQDNLADEIGINKSTLVRWEKSDNISTANLEKIAKALEITINELYQFRLDPVNLFKDKIKSTRKRKIEVTIELDGTPGTLQEWIITLNKINAAI